MFQSTFLPEAAQLLGKVHLSSGNVVRVFSTKLGPDNYTLSVTVKRFHPDDGDGIAMADNPKLIYTADGRLNLLLHKFFTQITDFAHQGGVSSDLDQVEVLIRDIRIWLTFFHPMPEELQAAKLPEDATLQQARRLGTAWTTPHPAPHGKPYPADGKPEEQVSWIGSKYMLLRKTSRRRDFTTLLAFAS